VDFDILELVIYYININNNKLNLLYKKLNYINKDLLINTIKNSSSLNFSSNEINNLNLNNCEFCFINKFH